MEGLAVLYVMLAFVFFVATILFATIDLPGWAIGCGVATIIMVVCIASVLDRISATATP
jgi:hypothetical protein